MVPVSIRLGVQRLCHCCMIGRAWRKCILELAVEGLVVRLRHGGKTFSYSYVLHKSYDKQSLVDISIASL